MTSQILLRNYRSSDLDAIVRLDESCFPAAFRFDRNSMQTFAEQPNAVCLIAEAAGEEIAGFVLVHLQRSAKGHCGYLVTLDVAASFRHEGIARRLMIAVETRIAAEGALQMKLHVFTENEVAIRFYERLGYLRVGVRQDFYGSAGDAFLYRKALANR